MKKNSRTFNIKIFVGTNSTIKTIYIFSYTRYIARRRGAIVGKDVTMPLSFAKRVNSNLIIGNNVSIARGVNFSSFRYKCIIGNNVIIGTNVRFVMGSHNIDSEEWEHVRKGSEELIIEDYVWICPDSTILPSVKIIGRGAVVGACSVVCKDVEEMLVVGGNPATPLRYRKCVHTDLVIESLLSGDLKNIGLLDITNEIIKITNQKKCRSQYFGRFGTIYQSNCISTIILNFWSVDLYSDWIVISAVSSFFTMTDMGLGSVTANKFVMSFSRNESLKCNRLLTNNIVMTVAIAIIVIVGCYLFVSIFNIVDILKLSILSRRSANYVFLMQVLLIFIGMIGMIWDAIFRANSWNYKAVLISNMARFQNVLLLHFLYICIYR